MKPTREFIAQRPLARHCPELLRAGPAPAELLTLHSRFGERLARALATALGRMAGGDAPVVEADPSRESAMAELAVHVAPLAANSLLALGADNIPVLASIEAEAVFRLLDRAFGGRGAVPEPLPDAFPLSAELFVARLEAVVASVLGEVLACAPARALRRDSSLDALAPFVADRTLATLAVEVTEHGHAPWTLTLAVPLDALAGLHDAADRSDVTPSSPARRRTPTDEPFAAVPLTLRAVVVELSVPVSRVAALKPGDLLPVAVARQVPLRCGDITVASGTLGAMDDRVAIQITQAF